MTRNETPLFGAHMSVAGGIQNAFYAGAKIGCDCLQVFVKNQRQWKAPALTHVAIEAYKQAAAETGLAPVIAHGSYLLNLASPNPATRRQSIDAVVDELSRCEALGIRGLVVHPGAHLDDTLEAGIQRIAASLDEIHARFDGRCRVLLETTAGQGSSIGHRFEHLGEIRSKIEEPARIGFCLDTCHIFAAGYDFRSPATYEATMAELEEHLGSKHVYCIHANDSKRELGSRIDRHAHIGKGKIARKGFVNFVNDPRWFGKPFILETPKGEDDRGRDWDKVNIERLKRYSRGR